MATQEWNIKARGVNCAITSCPFSEGEPVYTVLLLGAEGYERFDCSEEGWNQKPAEWSPLSSWKSPFKAPPPVPTGPLKQTDAQGLLRVLMQENDPLTLNARSLLALMLERKKQLRVVDRQENSLGEKVVIYEHVESGETWIIQDPQLKLDQLQPVQVEVAELLKIDWPHKSSLA